MGVNSNMQMGVSTKLRKLIIRDYSKRTKKLSGSHKKMELISSIKKLGRGYKLDYINLAKDATILAKQLATANGSQISPSKKNKLVSNRYLNNNIVRKLHLPINQVHIKKTQQHGGVSSISGSNSIEPIDIMSHKNYFDKLFNAFSKDNLSWGLGVEHEMQIFHLGKKVDMTSQEAHKTQSRHNYSNANIMFDSQESTCFITGDMDKAGACCKSVPGGCSYSPPASIRKQLFSKKDKLSPDELDFLMSLDWEATGRYAKGCKGGSIIVDRVPILMPELVTSAFKNRTVNSIANESIFQEEMFIKCQLKNPFTREKVKLYGPLVTHKCGTVGNIQVPKRPTYIEEEYELEKDDWKDYVGSYHITITLPHTKNITVADFVKLHQDSANQIQWLEPLLITAFFSPDPDAMGLGPDQGIEGSFRVGAVGWGNFAGSDVRKFGDVGITRGAMIPSKWRDRLDLVGTERLNECVATAPPQYKKAINILTSDFRTFNVEMDPEKCARLYNPNDCPKADGGAMTPPYGMEIRIFDHFHSEHLLDLLKIIVLCSANSQRHPATKYVYDNKVWIKAMQDIMTRGWNTELSRDYITLLREQLGLELKGPDSRVAFDVFGLIITELHALNQSSMIVGLLDETPDIKPRIPSINRECWELAFNGAHMDVLLKHLAKHAGGRKSYNYTDFKKLLFGPESPFSQERWGQQADDICYALESRGRVTLTKARDTGGISTVRLQ